MQRVKASFSLCLAAALSLPALSAAELGAYDQAVIAYKSGRFSEVLTYTENAPGAAAKNLRSLALMNLGRYEEAGAANAQACQLDPKNTNYRYNAGLILLTRGDPAGAERTFRQAIADMPQSSRLYEGLGETLYHLARYPDAEKMFRRAVELDESNSGAQIALAKLLYAVEDQPNFDAAVLKAIRMAPDNYLACYYFGKHLEQHGDQDGAGKYYQKSCTLAPVFFDGLIAWGGILARQNNLRAAATAYERAQAARPDDSQVYYLLSVVYRKLGNTERAQWALQEFDRHAKP